jgi:ParB family chromosome partitioning protein
LPVNAVIAEQFGDKELFEAMDRENRARKNLSPWEQGRMYDEALKGGLYSSLRRLAESLGVDHSAVSKTIQLAKFPKEVVAAFASPLDLQVRWAKPLTDALQRDPDGVLTRAKELASNRGALGSAEIFERLAGIGQAVGRSSPPADIIIKRDRKPVAMVCSDKKGRVQIRFEVELDASRRRELAKLVEDFLAK